MYLDQPQRLLQGLYLFAKFGRNQSGSFDNMAVKVFCVFALKTPIHTSKLGF